MIERFYSQVEKDKLLHLVYRPPSSSEERDREDLIGEENFLQCSFLRMEKGKTFRPHKHIFKKKSYDKQITQESWVVIRGSVRCIFYDLDDKVLVTPVLRVGDASFTLEGGHTYEILEDDTLVYEYKTGPYEGQKLDKEFI